MPLPQMVHCGKSGDTGVSFKAAVQDMDTQDDVAGVQLAVVVAVKLLLSQHQGSANATKALEAELERMRANILGSGTNERRLWAFDEAAEALLEVLRAK